MPTGLNRKAAMKAIAKFLSLAEAEPGSTQAEALHDYWNYIASLLAAQRIQVPAEELVKLEHEVHFGPRLQRLLASGGR
ncbi:hypothetical protein ACLQ8T_05540 [Glutamicibacter sp. FR1]|uniref:hypothetical protein n=1 Tax=Glutamicibacter sp. FR1 TaxID=3393744 RepID=UPI0039AF9C58